MTLRLSLLLLQLCLIASGAASSAQADGEVLAFAVVSEAPRKTRRGYRRRSLWIMQCQI